MFLVYNSLIILATLIFLPVIILKIASNENLRLGLKSRFTIYPQKFIDSLDNNNLIWIHASSVGEVNLSVQLVKSLKEKMGENIRFIITTMTVTGLKNAKQAGVFHYTTLVPFDISFLVKRFFRIFSPKMILIAETEFWPNIFFYAKKNKTPLLVFNCRISDSSEKNYLKFKFFFRKVLNPAHFFLCQNNTTCERLKALGVNEKKIILSKNIKFDITFPDYDKNEIFKEFGISPENNLRIITAGSTHANEEEILIDTFIEIEKTYPELLLIIAPRHIERTPEIVDILKKRNITFALYSENVKYDPKVLILDQIGYLAKAYSVSNVCFIGGSLILRGGHNPLEAAYFKKPIISGRNIFNFSEIYKMLEKNNGAVLINNSEELKDEMLKILKNKKYAEKIALNAYKVLSENKGALKTTVNYILKCLY